jgi:hypothetical protein
VTTRPAKYLGCVLAAGSLFAAGAPAAAQARYSIRNDTPVPYTCGLKRHNSMTLERFLLPPGGEWSIEAATPRIRTLRCDTFRFTPRYYMRPNVRYNLEMDPHDGRIVMRRID